MAIGRTNVGFGGGGSGGTLVVTAPEGVTVTISKDGKEKHKKVGAGGLAIFEGLKTGIWSITISDETQISAARNVEIVVDYEVAMTFFDGYLYDHGSVNESITGGWKKDGNGTVYIKSNGSVEIAASTDYGQSIYRTVNKIDLSNFTKLTMNGKMYEQNGWHRTRMCIWSNVTYGNYAKDLVAYTLGNSNSEKDYTLDVSGLTGSYYIGIAAIDHPNWGHIIMNTMRLE